MPIRTAVAGLAALSFVTMMVTTVAAQTQGGAYDRLAPGDQRIARSLFEAQRRSLPPGSRLSLDEIAARRRDGAWGSVFKSMKADGLITGKTLSRIVDRQRSGR